jgi:hypothetical protein
MKMFGMVPVKALKANDCSVCVLTAGSGYFGLICEKLWLIKTWKEVKKRENVRNGAR